MADDEPQQQQAGAAPGDDSSSSDSDSEDFELDAAAEQQIMQLESQLAANPNNYDTHVEV